MWRRETILVVFLGIEMLDKYISKKQYPKESKEQDIGMGYILLSLFIYFKCPILRVIIFKWNKHINDTIIKNNFFLFNNFFSGPNGHSNKTFRW